MFSISLFSAPHRAFFTLGTTALIGLMVLWFGQLLHPAYLSVPAGWVHSWLMIHGIFAPFVFGFVFTAMPKWVDAQSPAHGAWFTTFLVYTLGLGVAVIGPLVSVTLSLIGWVMLTLGWGLVLLTSFRIWMQGRTGAVHSLPALFSMTLGGLSAFSITVWHFTEIWQWSFIGMRLGFWGFLFILYVTVSHRMLPFFASCVVKDYVPRRPTWALLGFVFLTVIHLTMDLIHAYHMIWLPDGLMLVLAGFLGWTWRWRGARNPLLTSLFVAWGSLCVGLALSTCQSVWLAFTGEFVLGRAPLHWIGIGYFGAMLIAMATRVTRGHSGRPLVMPPIIWWCCIGFQVTAIARLLADWPGLGSLSHGLLLLSAALWIACASIWAAPHFPMYVRPRADGKPG